MTAAVAPRELQDFRALSAVLTRGERGELTGDWCRVPMQEIADLEIPPGRMLRVLNGLVSRDMLELGEPTEEEFVFRWFPRDRTSGAE